MYEQKLINKIIGGTSAIKRGEKKPSEAGIGKLLNQLKPMNEGMHEELFNNYKAAVNIYKELKGDENE